MADAAALRAAVQRIASHYGAIHVLVNNAAAVTPKNSVADLPLADWQQAFAVNVTGAFLLAQAVIPHMRAAGGGVINSDGTRQRQQRRLACAIGRLSGRGDVPHL